MNGQCAFDLSHVVKTDTLQQAAVHLARGDGAQARSTAERGLLYCNSQAQCDALRGFVR